MNYCMVGKIPKIVTVIAAQRVRFSGHCWRSKNELAHQLLLWEPTHGKRARGRPRRTFTDQLVDDTELQKEDLANAMNDREYWKSKVVDVRLRSTRNWTNDILCSESFPHPLSTLSVSIGDTMTTFKIN